ncbi:MAG: protein kinase [Methanoregula sp.]
MIEEIGHGKNGVVYKAIDESINHKIACKLIPVGRLKNGWQTEIKKVIRLEGILQIIHYFGSGNVTIDSQEFVYILWEYIEGENLGDYLKNKGDSITLELVRSITDEILNAFFAMHQQGISHNDLHEGNILIYKDPRVITDNPRIKITDFGIGGSYCDLKPKDDYREFARICHNLLDKINPDDLVDGKDRYFYDVFIEDFIPKKLLEKDFTQGTYVKNPRELLSIFNSIPEGYYKLKSERPIKLTQPFDYLRCEQIGNSFKLLQKLYSHNFPGYDDILQRNNTILTGPRGCGKTTLFKNLSLKAQLAAQNFDGLKEPFIGIYYHCYDLYFAFPYIKFRANAQGNQDKRNAIINYFNLSILIEILDLLEVADSLSPSLLNKQELGKLELFISDYYPDYERPPTGSNIIRYLKEFTNYQKKLTREWFYHRISKKPIFLPMDFIPAVSKILQSEFELFHNKPIYYLLDDYSLPTISLSLQETINDFIFFPAKDSEHFFKISTESIVTFYNYTSTRKMLVENREYVSVDLGNYFLTSDMTVINSFLTEVINNRLKNSENISPMYHDIQQILGASKYKSCNDLARNIRNEKDESDKKQRVLYYGWPLIVLSCTGDIANTLELVKSIFADVGPKKFSIENGLQIPIEYAESDIIQNTHLQDKAIREAGITFLQRIGQIPEEDYGTQLKKITECFGHVAHWYLMNITSKNEKTRPPHQACRIELQEPPELDGETKQIYDNLIRYGIFFRDSRGKSQRGEAMDRLYLRRILIPTFKLTYSKRDSIRLDPKLFALFLSRPEEFESLYTQRGSNKGRMGKTETRAIIATLDKSQRSFSNEKKA